MKKFLLIFIAFFPLLLHAQETFYVPPGANVYFGKAIPAAVFGYLRNSGNISLENKSNFFFLGKIWINDNGSMITNESIVSNSGNGGTIHFLQPNPMFGNQGQQIFHTGFVDSINAGVKVSNIVLDNNAGIILTSDLNVLNTFQFKRGHLFANQFKLVLGDSNVTGKIMGYDASRFVVTAAPTVGGALKYQAVEAGVMVHFPIGPMVNNYTPVALVNKGRKNGFEITATNVVLSRATTGTPVLDSTLPVTWVITKQNENIDDVVVTLQHELAVENPAFTANREKSFISMYVNNTWDRSYNALPAQSPGTITTSFPVNTTYMNSRTFTLGNGILYLTKKVTKAPKAIPIPNAFSPNGDRVNDQWIIPALKEYPNCSVEIFNRYGQIVFQSKGYYNPWDGTKNGANLPVGTYYYLVHLQPGDAPLSGWVVLLK